MMKTNRHGLLEKTWLWLEQKEWWNRVLFQMLLWSGTRLFRVVASYAPDGGHVRALHFALSQGDLNTSVRLLVESLDQECQC